MSETVSRRRGTSRQSDHIVLLMLLMVVIPAAITLHTVRVPQAPQDFSSNLLRSVIPGAFYCSLCRSR